LTQTFVESCVDSEVVHLSVLRVQRLPYLKIPTLNGHEELCSALHTAASMQRFLKAQVNFSEAAWCCLRIMEE